MTTLYSPATSVDTISDEGGLRPLIAPEVQILIPPITDVRQRSVIVSFPWTQPVADFNPASDIVLANCELSNFQGSAAFYTANATVPTDTQGIATITVGKGAGINSDGIRGPTSDITAAFSFNTQAPPFSITGVSSFCQQMFDFNASDFPYFTDETGGSFEGVLEMVADPDENHLYAVLQIGRYNWINRYGVDQIEVNALSDHVQARAVLVQLALDTCTWTTIKEYQNVSTAARSLKMVDGDLYWFEGSNYAQYNQGDFQQLPETADIIHIGNLSRESPVDTLAGDYSADANNIRIVLNAEETANISEIRDELKTGNRLIVGNTLVQITSVAVSGARVNMLFTIGYRSLNNVDFETVGLSSDVIIVPANSFETVFSRTRLQGVEEDWQSKIGNLYRKAAGDIAIENLGRNWISGSIDDDPNAGKTKPRYEIELDPQERERVLADRFYGVHGGTISPLVSDGERIHAITGYGALDNIDDNSSEAAKGDNWQWISYGSKLDPKITELLTNDRTVLDILRDIAVVTQSIIGFRGGQFFLRPRSVIQAKLSAQVSPTITSFPIKELTRDALPTSGTMIVEDEVISYSAATAERISPVMRGQQATDAVQHNANTVLTFVDHIVALNANTLEQPIDAIRLENDFRQLYNQITVRYGSGKTYTVENQESIDSYGIRPVELSVPLDDSQRAWVAWIANGLLAHFSTFRQIITVTLKTSLYLKLGETVLLQCEDRASLNRAVQVISLRHNIIQRQTVMQCVTI